MLILKWIGLRRHVLAVMGLIAASSISMQRISLSITIVTMTEIYPVTSPNGTKHYIQEFEWDNEDEGEILSSYFYGYTITQFLGGWIAARFGGVKVFGTGLILSSLVTILIPFVITNNMYTLMAMRILQGALQGVTTPALIAIWSHWSANEKTKLVTITFSGFPLGSMIGMTLCGVLLDYFRWHAAFYVTGIIGVLCSVIWFSFARETPIEDPWMSKEELTDFSKNKIPNSKGKDMDPPFGKIFTSLPLLASVTLAFCSGFGTYTLQTELPTFFEDIYHIDTIENGLVSSLPDLFTLVSYLIAGHICDVILQKGALSTTKVRKLFACCAFLGQAAFMMSLTLTSNFLITILLFSLVKFLVGFSCTTIDVSPLDLAPRYAGVLYGLVNTFSTLAGSLAPMYCGFIAIDKNLDEWHVVFRSISFAYLFGCIVYGIFGSGEVQSWALATNDEEKNEESGL